LRRNQNLKFICRPTTIVVENNETMFTTGYASKQEISVPIAHGEGNYYCDDQTLKSLIANKQIVFTYKNDANGSIKDIAGITNEQGNVLGMMPHPERAVDLLLGSNDGLLLFKSILRNWREAHVLTS